MGISEIWLFGYFGLHYVHFRNITYYHFRRESVNSWKTVHTSCLVPCYLTRIRRTYLTPNCDIHITCYLYIHVVYTLQLAGDSDRIPYLYLYPITLPNSIATA